MASRDPAPGALEIVRRFVNTLDLESNADEIGTPDQLQAFLREASLPSSGEPPSDGDVARAHEIREALRELLLSNHDGIVVDPSAIDRLNDAAGDAALALRFEPDGSSRLLPQASGLDRAIGELLSIVFASMQQGTWERLKACRSDTCRWAFYDHSKNHSSKWCSMAVCGNRAKAKAYRRRQKLGA